MAVTAHPSRLRVGSPDYLIVAAVAALVVLGIIAVYSSSFALGILEYGDANYFVFRQVFFAFLGVSAMWLLMKSDYRRLWGLSPLPVPAGAPRAVGGGAPAPWASPRGGPPPGAA